MYSIPPVTQKLLIANGIVFAAQMIADDDLISWFALWPLGSPSGYGTVGFLPWQVVTYSFLHGNLIHLFFNMFALFMFGSDIERVFGARRYLVYYFGCVAAAAIAQLAVSALTAAPPYPTVGASGGVFGLLLAYGMYFPQRQVMLIFPPIPMPAWLFVVLYGLLTLYLGIAHPQGGIAHFAHLGGMLGGFLILRYWRRPPSRRPW